jgi:hypothetical protein
MQELLIRKLHNYIQESHPDLLITLQEESRVEAYLLDAVNSIDGFVNDLLDANEPLYLIEENCFEKLVKSLGPSRFLYIKDVLEEAFPNEFERLLRHGVLTTEVINLITFCDPVFEGLLFSTKTEDSSYLRYAIIGSIHEYFQKEEVLQY